MDRSIYETAGVAWRALTARKDGPSLYDVCDPLLLNGHGGDAHLCKFYRTGKAPVSLQETLEILTFMEAADESKRQGGKTVRISDVTKRDGG